MKKNESIFVGILGIEGDESIVFKGRKVLNSNRAVELKITEEDNKRRKDAREGEESIQPVTMPDGTLVQAIWIMPATILLKGKKTPVTVVRIPDYGTNMNDN